MKVGLKKSKRIATFFALRTRRAKIIVFSFLFITVGGGLFFIKVGVPKYRSYQISKQNDYLSAARLAANKNDYGSAEDAFSKALAIEGLSPTVWRELGLVYQKDHKIDQAIAAYNKSLSAVPNDAFTWNLVGNLYRDTKQYAQAENAYQQSIKQDDRLQTVVINLSQLYILEDNTSKAITLLSSHYDNTPQTAQIGIRLAYVYMLNTNKEQAIEVLKSVLLADPNNSQAKVLLNAYQK